MVLQRLRELGIRAAPGRVAVDCPMSYRNRFYRFSQEEFRMKNLTIGMLALSGLLLAGCSYQTQIDQATSQAESSAQQASTASSNAQNSANTAAQSAKTAEEAAAGAEDSVKRANDAVARLEAAFASSVTK
jgi:outer membrane murein-binding lipoprotein Lpp